MCCKIGDINPLFIIDNQLIIDFTPVLLAISSYLFRQTILRLTTVIMVNYMIFCVKDFKKRLPLEIGETGEHKRTRESTGRARSAEITHRGGNLGNLEQRTYNQGSNTLPFWT